MSLKRYATRRDANEGEIIEVLRAVGASVQTLSIKGAADLLVGFRGVNFLIEVKTLKGKLTDDEVIFHDDWQGQVDIARTPEEALEIIGA